MTTRQMQCLLTYLGYEAAPDGIPGPQTEAAVAAFRKDRRMEGAVQEETWAALKAAVARDDFRQGPDFWKELRYFRRSDPYIGCPCGACGGFPAEPEETLMKLADQVRDHFGVPLIPSSTVRCGNHNIAVGGVTNSRHLQGKAMDFSLRGIPAAEVLAYVKTLPQVRYAYAIGQGHVHMDTE